MKRGQDGHGLGRQSSSQIVAMLIELSRHSVDARDPAEAVDFEKHSARFDVLAVNWPAGQRRPTIEHIQNAFDVVGRGQMFS